MKVDKPWGYEKIWAYSDLYAGKILSIKKGHRLSKQHHEFKTETIYVLSGSINLMIYNDKLPFILEMSAGHSYFIEPGIIHRMEALEDAILLEVSTPELDDVVRHKDDYGRHN